MILQGRRSEGPSSARPARVFLVAVGVSAAILIGEPSHGRAQEAEVVEATALRKLSFDELFDLEVTSVSKNPEPLARSASAIQVVTGDDIRRSGATSLPEALRLAANLQVAQVNAHDWAVTARGFNGAPLGNNSLANKLLILIDGRTIYTPLFGGVFWDVQTVLLEDVDRIEVISGPGGTLWGANAVNGVINVVTKSADATPGFFVSAAGGTSLRGFGAARYGGRAGRLAFRVYGQHADRAGTELPDGSDARDEWNHGQGGFRLDFAASDADRITLQGDAYRGREGDPTTSEVDGENAVARWTRTFSPRAELSVQAFIDRTWRNLPQADFSDQFVTFDVDVQHRWPLGDRQSVLWGADFRLMRDQVDNSPAASFVPADRTMRLVSGFIQDEIDVAPDHLKLTIGAKVERNEFSGVEGQPSARLAWTLTPNHTLWAAASRAVRAPSRIDTEFLTPTLSGNPDFVAEELLAYELGWRARPIQNLSLALAGFYHRYEDLRSINVNPTPPTLFIFANGQEGDSRGVELTGALQASAWWRLRAGYTFLNKHVRAANATVVPGSDVIEGIDPESHWQFHSSVSLPGSVEFDLVGRYVDPLVALDIPGYFACDARAAYRWRTLEMSVVGRNLWEERHAEFGTQIPRSGYVGVQCAF